MRKLHNPAGTITDVELFRASVSDVTPLRQTGKLEYRRPRPRPVPTQRLLDDRETLKDSLSNHLSTDAAMETGNELTYARDGVGIQTLRRLRRGHWVIQGELDLHGLTVAEARELLAQFLNECRRSGRRCVRIIHGKGLRSKNREPVLKHKVAQWLMRREEILAFCQARPVDGGGGAMMVLLRGSPKTP